MSIFRKTDFRLPIKSEIGNENRRRLAGRIALLCIMSLIAGLALNLASPQTAQAGGVVTNCANDTQLRALLVGGGAITFNCGTTTIQITSELVITAPTTINGGGTITLSGRGQNRVINNKSSLLTIQNLTIRDASATTDGAAITSAYLSNLSVYNSHFYNNVCSTAPNTDSGGGAIFVHTGTLIVDNSEFKDNKSYNSSGGAIHALLSNVSVTNSVFTTNVSTSPGYSGAFYNDGVLGANGYIILHGNLFNGNVGQGQGGAVFNFLYAYSGSPYQPGSYVSIDRSSFINNSVTPDARGDAFGGGLRHGNGRLILTNSLFYNNSAQSQGGGIWTGEDSNIDIANVTLTGNSTPAGGLGGALTINSTGPFNITNSTIAGNSAGGQGGGIFGGSSTVNLRNSIISNNTAGNPWNINFNCSTPLNNGGNNLQYPSKTNDTNDHNCANNITIADPLLSSLANNGGPTYTMALLSGSPAINAGNNATCAASPVNNKDQRGFPRPVGSNCDIGAFEVTSAPTVSKAFSPTSIQFGSTSLVAFTLTNPTAAPLTNVSFTDTLPNQLKVATSPDVNNACGSGTVTATAGSGSINVAGVSLAANQTCTIQVRVVPQAIGSFNNITSAITATETNPGNPSNTATLIVKPLPPTIQKAFSPATILATSVSQSSTSTLSFTLQNPNAVGLSGVAFSDNFPAGLVVASSPTVTNNCATPGTVTATAGSGSVNLSGLGLNANQTCTISLKVSSASPGVYPNVSGQISSTESGTGSTSNSASLQVVVPAFSSSPVMPGGNFILGVVQTAQLKTANLTIHNNSHPITTLTVGLSGGSVATALTGLNASDFNLTAPLAFPLNLAGGTSQNITLTCTPTVQGTRSANLTLTTNDPNQPTVSFNLKCVGATAVVSSNSDNGLGNQANTLSQALTQANTAGQGIAFNLGANNVITFTSPLSVSAHAGVVIDGGCNGGTPGVILDGAGFAGNGLTLGGGNTIIGLLVKKFAGKQIVAGPIGGNTLNCVVVSKN